MVEDQHGCQLEEQILIAVPIPIEVALGEDQTIPLGDSILIQALVNQPSSSLDSIQWTSTSAEICENCLEQWVSPKETTTYQVYIKDEGGCEDVAEITIFIDRDQEIYFPNAFSPNADGINDFFFPFADDREVVNVQVLNVYDRWGNKIFVQNDFLPNNPAFGWDGTFRDEPMNNSVFIWWTIVEYLDGSECLFSGDMTLMR